MKLYVQYPILQCQKMKQTHKQFFFNFPFTNIRYPNKQPPLQIKVPPFELQFPAISNDPSPISTNRSRKKWLLTTAKGLNFLHFPIGVSDEKVFP